MKSVYYVEHHYWYYGQPERRYVGSSANLLNAIKLGFDYPAAHCDENITIRVYDCTLESGDRSLVAEVDVPKVDTLTS